MSIITEPLRTVSRLADEAERLRQDLEVVERKLDESRRELDESRRGWLTSCIDLGAALRDGQADVESDLRKGVEAGKFLLFAEEYRAACARALKMYERALEGLADWTDAGEKLPPLVEETTRFIAWIDEIIALVRRPGKPIDPSLLPELGALPPGAGPRFTSLEDLTARGSELGRRALLHRGR
jgi:hypothetical protein